MRLSASTKRTGKKSDQNVPSPDLPVLDDVQELIEKERILLNLKLLDQQQVAEEWKKKYDNLLENIREPFVELNVDSKSFSHNKEDIGTIHFQQRQIVHDMNDFHNAVVDRLYSWIADINGILSEDLSIGLFAKFCKHIFGVRSPFEKDLSIVWLRNCELRDDFIPSISFLLRSPRLEAIDLSHNSLSQKFLQECVPVLKDRSTAPQYILLAGNLSLLCDEIRFPMSQFIDALTSETWGLTITLPDFPVTLIPDDLKRDAKKNELHADYKELIKQPLKALEFLETLNDRLQQTSGSVLPLFDVTKKKAPKSPGKTRVKKAALDTLGRNPLHFLSVLGLSHAHLCKQSLDTLEVTLQTACFTLTDLDLSCAYIGFHGAQVLKRSLARAECQLVCLRVMSNALGDAGATAISSTLKENRTVTYLDLRCNDLTNSGLRGIVEHLRLNPVFHTVDVRSNSKISRDVVISMRRMFKSGGRPTAEIRWTDFGSPQEKRGNQEDSARKELLSIPEKVTVSMNTRKRTGRLYSIETSKLFANFPRSDLQASCLLSWQWRLNPIPHSHLSEATLGKGKRSSLSSRLCSPPRWEVRVTFSHQTTVLHRGVLPNTSQLHTGQKGFQLSDHLEGENEWAPASALLVQGIPNRGRLELWILTGEDGSDSKTSLADSEGDVLLYEALNFKLERLRSQESIRIGGDSATLSGDVNAFCSRQCIDADRLSVMQKDNFALQRCFQFIFPPMNASGRRYQGVVTLEWQSRINFAAHLHNEKSVLEGGEEKESTAVKHRSLGYQWCIVLHSFGNSNRAMGDGVVDGMSDEGSSDSERPGRPSAWGWKQHSIQLPAVQFLPSDQISLSARVISSEYNAPAALMKDCEVAVKQFHVHFTAVDDGKDSSGGPGNRSLNYLHETGHFIPDLDPSLLYAASNSYTLHYPF